MRLKFLQLHLIISLFICLTTGNFAGEAPEYTSPGWNGSIVDARNVEGFRGSSGRPTPPRDV